SARSNGSPARRLSYCPSAMRARTLLAAALACLPLALAAGCGKGTAPRNRPVIGVRGTEKQAAEGLGFPSFATKNTTRIGGADAVADAAAVARAVFPAATADRRPGAVTSGDPFTVADEIDRLVASARGGPSDSVVIASADAPAYAMPAAAWAAKSGDPVLFVKRDVVPPVTRTALRRHQQPKIYVLGPGKAVGARVLRSLRKLGTVKRIEGKDPVRNAIAFARYVDGGFGWGVVDPGHGLVFAAAADPLVAAAAAPLSAAGTYGPLLLLDRPRSLPRPLSGYLRDLQPGY